MNQLDKRINTDTEFPALFAPLQQKFGHCKTHASENAITELFERFKRFWANFLTDDLEETIDSILQESRCETV